MFDCQSIGKSQWLEAWGYALHLKLLLRHLAQDPLELQVNRTAPPVGLIAAASLIVHQHNLWARGVRNKHTEIEYFTVQYFTTADLLGTWICNLDPVQVETYLAISSDVSYKVNGTLLPQTHLL